MPSTAYEATFTTANRTAAYCGEADVSTSERRDERMTLHGRVLPDVWRSTRPLANVPLISNRTNNPRRISAGKSIRGNIPGDYRTRRDNGVLAHCYAADNGRAGCDSNVSLNHDGLCDYVVAPLGRFNGMAGRDDAHVRPDHHIVGNVEPAKVRESAVPIYEDITPDTDINLAGCVERWYQHNAVAALLADEIAEQGPDFIRIVECQPVESGGDRHRPFDVS
jgi:hypothetical protein